MTDLVFCLSKDEKWWPHLLRLISEGSWGSIFAVTDSYCRQRFKSDKKIEYIVVDFSMPAAEIIDDIGNKLKGRLSELEVALNMVSGGGKEHMAVLSSLLKLGVGIRLVAVTKKGVVEV